jgi:serine/threonine-protein kinase
VAALYSHVSNQDWDGARSQFGDALAAQFDPGFFAQFDRVSVDNLRVTGQTADTIELLGENTYVYTDGSTQREERTFTVEMRDGQPRIVASSFKGVLQSDR